MPPLLPQPVVRPKSPVVFGIINLALAAMGVMSAVAMLMEYLGHSAPATTGPEVPRGSGRMFSDIAILAGFVILPLQIAAAVGLIRLRDWARKTTIALAAGHLALALGVMALATGVLRLPGTPKESARAFPIADPGTEKRLEFFNQVFGAMEAIIATMLVIIMTISLVYSLLQLFFLTRPRVRLACQGART